MELYDTSCASAPPHDNIANARPIPNFVILVRIACFMFFSPCSFRFGCRSRVAADFIRSKMPSNGVALAAARMLFSLMLRELSKLTVLAALSAGFVRRIEEGFLPPPRNRETQRDLLVLTIPNSQLTPYLLSN